MPALSYELPEESVRAAVRRVLESLPRTRIVQDEPTYLRAEVHSRMFRFVDDVEFLIEVEQRRIRFRSASRRGYSDLGVNRKRMEAICRALVEIDGITIAES